MAKRNTSEPYCENGIMTQTKLWPVPNFYHPFGTQEIQQEFSQSSGSRSVDRTCETLRLVSSCLYSDILCCCLYNVE